MKDFRSYTLKLAWMVLNVCCCAAVCVSVMWFAAMAYGLTQAYPGHELNGLWLNLQASFLYFLRWLLAGNSLSTWLGGITRWTPWWPTMIPIVVHMVLNKRLSIKMKVIWGSTMVFSFGLLLPVIQPLYLISQPKDFSRRTLGLTAATAILFAASNLMPRDQPFFLLGILATLIGALALLVNIVKETKTSSNGGGPGAVGVATDTSSTTGNDVALDCKDEEDKTDHIIEVPKTKQLEPER